MTKVQKLRKKFVVRWVIQSGETHSDAMDKTIETVKEFESVEEGLQSAKKRTLLEVQEADENGEWLPIFQHENVE
jgi:hypothetical protein